MKFIHYLKSISGISVFPMLSLGIFLFFFLAVAIWAIKADKKLINVLKNIPLE